MEGLTVRGGYRIPMHGNLPVPYITRYSSEAPDLIAHNAQMGFREIVGRTGPNGETLYYLDDSSDACFRDPLDGWLWVPAPDDRSGKVEFSQVHPLRHRRCMIEYRCQVCANVAGPKVRFRLPLTDIDPASYNIVTTQAPVCERCLRAAKVRCPHLVAHADEWFTILTERKYIERVGVIGDVVDIDGSFKRQGRVLNDDPFVTQTLARQQVIGINGAHIEIVERP